VKKIASLYENAYYRELAAFKTISHSVTMVISPQTSVYIEYCDLIGDETIIAVAQVPNAMVTRPLKEQ